MHHVNMTFSADNFSPLCFYLSCHSSVYFVDSFHSVVHKLCDSCRDFVCHISNDWVANSAVFFSRNRCLINYYEFSNNKNYINFIDQVVVLYCSLRFCTSFSSAYVSLNSKSGEEHARKCRKKLSVRKWTWSLNMKQIN